MHPATKDILQYFEWRHLKGQDLQNTSKVFADLAHMFAHTLEGPELTAGLRKLLEAKDCMVRAALSSERSRQAEGRPDA